MAIKIGDAAPSFALFDTGKSLRSLTEFKGKKTVLVFYPGAFTGVCTKELCTFQDSMSKFSELNAQIVGISVDGPFANKAFADQNKIAFPLLSDFSRSVSSQYGGLAQDLGGVKGYAVAQRAVFILDKEGIVRYSWVAENPGIEPNYEDVQSALSKIS
jgi:glutaredoxin-dependent peroxiredoxin